MAKTALIIGAGPAGLTAAYELLRSSDIRPVVVEASNEIGGLSRTVVYKGNRIDIGGHRFFSKSDWVMDWWQEILPLEKGEGQAEPFEIHYQNRSRPVSPSNARPGDGTDQVMMVRSRLSRIFFNGRFFDYPISLSWNTVANLGFARMLRIGGSYLKARLFPRRPEVSLEDFLVNRFGGELYRTFFESYTEKVWGMPCREISAEWGAQRIKGLSITRALIHAVKSLGRAFRTVDAQKTTETSLIQQFLYPRHGPGQLWEEVARRIREADGRLHLGCPVVGLRQVGGRIETVTCRDTTRHEEITFRPDYVISSMAIKDLFSGWQGDVPEEVRRVATTLPYRDFITVGLLVSEMKANPQSRARSDNNMPPDNWIYIQEPGVHLGRLQIFNNWSPFMVGADGHIWLGLEYFCSEGDELWAMDDAALKALAIEELAAIGLVEADKVLDGIVIKVPKAYPAYFGSYEQFGRVRQFLDGIDNLFLIGRNGMHRYNNQDHSMLTARTAVEAIIGKSSHDAVWDVNIGDDYHEEKAPG
ncbi:MAG: NAD(P)/FAD-dependent oxidoreductase [Pseudomonadota bacterium]